MLAERQRQIKAKGFTPEHDDLHTQGQLAWAAAAYAVAADSAIYEADKLRPAWNESYIAGVSRVWPWNWTLWKPTNKRAATSSKPRRCFLQRSNASTVPYPAKPVGAEPPSLTFVRAFFIWVFFANRFHGGRLNVGPVCVGVERRRLVRPCVRMRRAAPFAVTLCSFPVDIRGGLLPVAFLVHLALLHRSLGGAATR